MRRLLVAGNWKMNGSLASARDLARALGDYLAGEPERGAGDANPELAVCPAHPHIAAVADTLAGSAASVGAQDMCEHEPGAYTGEVAAEMLVELGCRYVLVGHSERRALFGDTDERVAAKFERARQCALVPVLCVGETLEEREADDTRAVVERQLHAVVARCGAPALASAVVAYEPVWAIGTGRTATPEQAQEVHALLRASVASQQPDVAAGLRILYGGSVKADNAASLFAMPDIDGGLVGGASLDAAGFMDIWRAAARA
ncbi:MAG: triose-phosphate isomerase [Gammaproteobacteria bacterium]